MLNPKTPIYERIEKLLELSKKHSKEYCSPDAFLSRTQYLARHPTKLIVLKCMDGRIHIPFATKTPLGIITPIRNLGGRFDMGWPYLSEIVFNTVMDAIYEGKNVLLINTYHYSKSDVKCGCAGFNYDCDSAIASAFYVRDQIRSLFGSRGETVYSIVWGIETDEDAIILHGYDGKVLNLSEYRFIDEDTLLADLISLYGDITPSVIRDILPLIRGNLNHIKEMKENDLRISVEHTEWILCLGRGFDFLHIPNIALIIGPYSPDLTSPIVKAASIIQSNMESGRISNDGFLLLTSSAYWEIGPDKARAEIKSRFLANFAAQVIQKELPEFYKKMYRITATLNWNTRSLEILEKD